MSDHTAPHRQRAHGNLARVHAMHADAHRAHQVLLGKLADKLSTLEHELAALRRQLVAALPGVDPEDAREFIRLLNERARLLRLLGGD